MDAFYLDAWAWSLWRVTEDIQPEAENVPGQARPGVPQGFLLHPYISTA